MSKSERNCREDFLTQMMILPPTLIIVIRISTSTQQMISAAKKKLPCWQECDLSFTREDSTSWSTVLHPMVTQMVRFYFRLDYIKLQNGVKAQTQIDEE
ncbi:hypothetical protein RchiOBHm_Chr4g0430191 [Rosa chinensis]|uniref:Uncharacterized protein n=1 Tax=Rosa chinensis TaxID=74649 RepID=A0A2P6R0E3_ROSCH|nr:hypothetical protein RchiOBHm_Chr4g0430191 [Rosa chinensis]